MAEIFTLSGPAYEMGDPFGNAAYELGRGFGDACAEQVSKLVITARMAKYLGAGAGLFGAYKIGQKRSGLGIAALLVGAALWFSEGKIYQHSRTLCLPPMPPPGAP